MKRNALAAFLQRVALLAALFAVAGCPCRTHHYVGRVDASVQGDDAAIAIACRALCPSEVTGGNINETCTLTPLGDGGASMIECGSVYCPE